MEKILSLSIRKTEKKSQRSISFVESRIKHLESLTKILNTSSITDTVNSIIDEYFENGFIYDEETKRHIPIKLVLEAIDSEVENIEDLREYLENQERSEDNE